MPFEPSPIQYLEHFEEITIKSLHDFIFRLELKKRLDNEFKEKEYLIAQKEIILGDIRQINSLFFGIANTKDEYEDNIEPYELRSRKLTEILLEIDTYIDEKLSGKTEVKESGKNNPTAKQQTLVIYFLNKINKINYTQDEIRLAEFTVFLTSKSKDNVYEHLRNPLAVKSDKDLLKDLTVVKNVFQNLSNERILKEIDVEIDKVKSRLNE